MIGQRRNFSTGINIYYFLVQTEELLTFTKESMGERGLQVYVTELPDATNLRSGAVFQHPIADGLPLQEQVCTRTYELS